MDQSKAWSSRSFGSRFQHGIFYAVIGTFGKRAAQVLLRLVVLWYVAFRPSLRRKADFYLRRRFPARGAWGRARDAYRLCLAFGQVLVDRAVLGILGPGEPAASPEDLAAIGQLLAEGRGLILVTAHVGGWQHAMACLAALRVPVSLLLHRDSGDVDKHFFEHRAGAPPFTVLDPEGYLGSTLEMLQVLREGGVLCIMGDRGQGAGTVAVPFLGAPVPLPFSPYKLASATGAPIAVIFPFASAGKTPLRLARIIRVPGGLGRAASAYRPYAEQFSQALEQFVADYPFQFFNFYDMWNEEPVYVMEGS
jgi:predicted LPLAT superfamily acyltransferase